MPSETLSRALVEESTGFLGDSRRQQSEDRVAILSWPLMRNMHVRTYFLARLLQEFCSSSCQKHKPKELQVNASALPGKQLH